MQRVLLVPDRFSDYRMWGGIPDRLAGRAEVSHLDRLIQLPWSGGSGAVVRLARGQRPGGWDVVVAAGRASPFAVALAEAGLTRGLVLAEPEIPFNRIPDEVEFTLKLPDDDVLAPYEPLVSAMHDASPEQWRDMMIECLRQTSRPDLAPAELDLAIQMATDHAADVRAELLAFAAADAAERDLPDEVQLAQLHARGRWLDQLAKLTVPVMTVVPAPMRHYAQTVSRYAAEAEIVIIGSTIQPGGAQDGVRDEAAAAIVRMLDRVGGSGSVRSDQK
jgi:hypothetical protein